jgi:hypothetical protein
VRFTFNEQLTDVSSLSVIRQAISNARRVVFLGFHFHQQNIDLLQTENAGGFVNVYATVVGRAQPEISVIKTQIAQMLRSERQNYIEVQDLRCKEMLDQFGTTLLR